MRLVKTRLRSSLTQENLEYLMIIAIEKDLEPKNNKEKIIDKFVMSSKELSSLILLCELSKTGDQITIYIRCLMYNWLY
jgi:hypothetical protein